MNRAFRVVLFGALLCLVSCLENYAFMKKQKNGDNSMLKLSKDRGELINCGDAHHNFTFQWSPATIVFDQQHTVTVFFNYTPTADWSEGRGCAVIHMEPYEDPIYEGCGETTKCTDISKVLPGVHCPFKKGKPVILDGVKIPMKAEVTIPAATFTVRLEAYSGSEMMLCAKGRVRLEDL